jgi:hypothetical protein
VTMRPADFVDDAHEFHYGVIGIQENYLTSLDVLAQRIVHEIETHRLWKNHDGFLLLLSRKGTSEFKDLKE